VPASERIGRTVTRFPDSTGREADRRQGSIKEAQKGRQSTRDWRHRNMAKEDREWRKLFRLMHGGLRRHRPIIGRYEGWACLPIRDVHSFCTAGDGGIVRLED
jgi:hypothetical protein